MTQEEDKYNEIASGDTALNEIAEPETSELAEETMPEAPESSDEPEVKAEEAPAPDSASSKREERKKKNRLTLEKLTQSEDEDDIRLSAQSITSGKFLRSLFYEHVWFILFLTGLMIIYIGNRYACQQEQIEQAKLIEKLTDRQFKALSVTSQLKECTRPSELMEMLNDSTLTTNNSPIYSLTVSEEE